MDRVRLVVEVVLKNTKDNGRVAILEKTLDFMSVPRIGDAILVGAEISTRWFKVTDVVHKRVFDYWEPYKIIIGYSAPEKVSDDEVKKDEEAFYTYCWKLLGSGVHTSV